MKPKTGYVGDLHPPRILFSKFLPKMKGLLIKIHSRFTLLLTLFTLSALACGLFNSAPFISTQDPNILFQDDFSIQSSGWDRVRDFDGIIDYDQDGYRILVKRPNFDFWSNPGLNFIDTHTEVEVRKLAGPDENDFGLICRYQDGTNFYFFIAGNDGFYGIGKIRDGIQSFIGMESMQSDNVINQGEGTTNKLRGDCVGDNLTFYVNDTRLASVQDSDLSSGDVGLIAGTFDEPGVDMLFDNFIVRKP